MISAIVCMLVFRLILYPGVENFNRHGVDVLIYSTITVTLVWITVTIVTPLSSRQHLKDFYRRVRPAEPLWGGIADEVRGEDPAVTPGYSLVNCLAAWLLATMFVLSVLLGTGKLLLGQPAVGGICFTLTVALWVVLRWMLSRGGI